jgi:hypothetical protein
MDCCCEMECEYAPTRRTAVSTSLALLEEKYRRSIEFGKYLEQHPDTETPLGQELQRCVSFYRMALHNVIADKTREPKKINLQSVPTPV